MNISLQLNTQTWDLMVDLNGLFVFADPALSIAQDVACAIRTWLGECWYNTALGMPYFQAILGKTPSRSFLKANIVAQASTVAGVTAATIAALSITSRGLSGMILVTTNTSNVPIEVLF